MDFSGKTVLITGGSRGIGRATALAFAEAGARVAINFRSDSEAAAETIEAMAGEDNFAVKADISHPGAVDGMIETVIGEFGNLDIVVNNAGIFVEHQIDQVNYDDWQSLWAKTMEVNLTGPANVCYCAAQHMMENQSGYIINISSRGAFRGEPDHPAYGASKAGMNSMSQSLAQKLAPHGIFVGVVAPGFVATDMAQPILDSDIGASIKAQSPLNRVADPDEIAQCVLFLSSGRANYATGCIFDVNGASYLRN